MKPTIERLNKFAVDANGCWIWTGAMGDSGYGVLGFRNGGRKYKRVAHRIMYQLVFGPVDAELEIDHLCRVRRCVNPAHLEAVTPAENHRRMVEAVYKAQHACKNGHPWATNGRQRPNGHRYCVACHREGELARRTRLPPKVCEQCGGHAARRFCSLSCSSIYAWAHSRKPSVGASQDARQDD